MSTEIDKKKMIKLVVFGLLGAGTLGLGVYAFLKARNPYTKVVNCNIVRNI